MSATNVRVIKEIKFGAENSVYFRFQGRSDLVEAKVLDIQKNAIGEPSFILLDRLIHKHGEDYFHVKKGELWDGNFRVSGCYVSCLSRG
jgi:hypothetical protein